VTKLERDGWLIFGKGWVAKLNRGVAKLVARLLGLFKIKYNLFITGVADS
jgi:hypothetical protein